MMFTLIDSYSMSLGDIENMIIWERDVYITLLNNKIEKERQRMEEQKAANFMSSMHQ
jgi:hypothetical protein